MLLILLIIIIFNNLFLSLRLFLLLLLNYCYYCYYYCSYYYDYYLQAAEAFLVETVMNMRTIHRQKVILQCLCFADITTHVSSQYDIT